MSKEECPCCKPIINFANDSVPHTEEEKVAKILLATERYGQFLDALGFNWRQDPNMADSPRRITESYVREIMSGCFNGPPKITAFANEGKNTYTGMVCQNNIEVVSLCSHHFQSIIGKAHVAYIPSKKKGSKIIGLSKLNRVVDYWSRRPSVQESLCKNIHSAIDDICTNNHGVAVMIEAKHNCCSSRGIQHASSMRTAHMSGAFLDTKDTSTRAEFYKFVDFAKHSL